MHSVRAQCEGHAGTATGVAHVGISRSFLTHCADDARLRRPRWTPGRMLTCSYGFREGLGLIPMLRTPP